MSATDPNSCGFVNTEPGRPGRSIVAVQSRRLAALHKIRGLSIP